MASQLILEFHSIKNTKYVEETARRGLISLMSQLFHFIENEEHMLEQWKKQNAMECFVCKYFKTITGFIFQGIAYAFVIFFLIVTISTIAY